MEWNDWQYGTAVGGEGADIDYFGIRTCQYDHQAPSTNQGSNTYTNTLEKSTAYVTKISTTTGTDDEIDLHYSNGVAGGSIFISFRENTMPNTVTRCTTTTTQISTINTAGESSEGDAVGAETEVFQPTTDIVNSAVQLAALASVLGGIAVAVGIALASSKICKKK
jgi:hypothetical protein